MSNMCESITHEWVISYDWVLWCMCYSWMSNILWRWVCCPWMRNLCESITHEWVISYERVREWMCYSWMSNILWKWECSSWMSNITHMNKQCLTYDIWMGHITHTAHHLCSRVCDITHPYVSVIHEWSIQRHTCEWVTSHIWMSYVSHRNTPRRTHEWVMSHIWTDTQACRYGGESGTCEWVTCEWLRYMSVTHSHVPGSVPGTCEWLTPICLVVYQVHVSDSLPCTW